MKKKQLAHDNIILNKQLIHFNLQKCHWQSLDNSPRVE